MKRFEDTELWDKDWFQSLGPNDKLAFMYVKDKCDPVGVWSQSRKIAEAYLGFEVDWDSLPSKVNGNIEVLDDGKWFLPFFCLFQYPGLAAYFKTGTTESKPLLFYVSLLQKHGLLERVRDTYLPSHNHIDTLSIPLAKGMGNPSLRTKEKEKEKEKEKVKDKDQEKEAKGLAKGLEPDLSTKLSTGLEFLKKYCPEIDPGEYVMAGEAQGLDKSAPDG